jgi:hypothetical protein
MLTLTFRVLLCLVAVSADCNSRVEELEEKVKSLEAQLHEAQHQLHFTNWGSKMAEHAGDFTSTYTEHASTAIDSCSEWGKTTARAVRDEAAKIKTAEDMYKVPLAAAEPHLKIALEFYKSDVEPSVGPVVSQVFATTSAVVDKVQMEVIPLVLTAKDDFIVQFMAFRKMAIKQIKSMAPQVAPHAQKVFDGVIAAIGSVLIILLLPTLFGLVKFLLMSLFSLARFVLYITTCGCFCSCLCRKKPKQRKGPAAQLSKAQKKGKQNLGFSKKKK